jgi:uncharacterized protein YecE (DUF72 family)
MPFWVGTSGFQYAEWKGTFYPEDLPLKKMLPYYAEHFSTTEINYSFRRIPSKTTLSNWAAATPAEFKFGFKAPERITHFARLKDCEETLRFFAVVISDLEKKLGPVLFQLPPKFPKDAERLRIFLGTMPSSIKAAFEFRDRSWLDDETFGILKEHNAALCIAETEKLSTPEVATANFGYLRLRREDFTPEQIKRWAQFTRAQTQWADTFIYFKHEEGGLGPKFGKQMIEALKNA